MTPQTFTLSDVPVVLFLVLLEGLLSADNALVLAIMVRGLPEEKQKKALFYGLFGAFVFRGIAILLAGTIIKFWWLQAVGALYLAYLPLKHFFGKSTEKEAKEVNKSFWGTIIAVEITDISFAIDSVLAAVAMVKASDKLWVVYVGAIIGIVLLRAAAGAFITLLTKFPNLDHVAYLLVGWVGVKLAMMAGHNLARAQDFAFSIPEMPAAVFWGVLAAICLIGGSLAMRKPIESPEMNAETEPE